MDTQDTAEQAVQVLDASTWTTKQLVDSIATGNALMADAKGKLAILNAELSNRAKKAADDGYARDNKQSGSVQFEYDGLPFKAEISKKVEWDGAALRSIAARLPWETTQRLFKIDMEMGEKIFTAECVNETLPAEILADLRKARTVKYGEPKITQRV